MAGKCDVEIDLSVRDFKDLASDSDSLEYSNDDWSEGAKADVADSRPPLSDRPPTHPGNVPVDYDQLLLTPERKRETRGATSGSGPLHMFSPGLSPIQLSNVGAILDGGISKEKMQAGVMSYDELGESNKQDVNCSVDSLDMRTHIFGKGRSSSKGQSEAPNYNFWKNTLFGTAEHDNNDSFHAVTDQDGNEMSLDSDVHVTKHSLVYPTPDTARAGSHPEQHDLSLDSEIMNVDRESLVYPTTAALYERSRGTQNGGDEELGHAGPNSAEDGSRHAGYMDEKSLVNESLLAERSGTATRGHWPLTEISEVHRQSMLDEGKEDSRYVENVTRLGHLSLLASSPHASFFRGGQDRSLLSVSLLPDSPATGRSERQQAHKSSAHRYGHRPQTDAAQSKRTVMLRPSAAAVRMKQLLVTSSDTECVSSAVKRRAAEHASRAPAHARDTSDLRSPTPVNLQLFGGGSAPSSRRPAPGQLVGGPPSAAQPPAQDGAHDMPRSRWDANRPHSPTAPALSRPASIQEEQRPGSQPHSPLGGVRSAAGLQVGGLYTLLLDGDGQPTFVPVVSAAQLEAAAAQTSYAPPVRNSGSPHKTAPSAPFLQTTAAAPTLQGTVRDPYRTNFSPVTCSSPPDPHDVYNSNHFDLERVLDRALHHGSLSAEKLNARWSSRRDGDSTATAASGLGDQGSGPIKVHSPTYVRPSRGAALATPVAGRPTNTATTQKVSPSRAFCVGLGEDGKQQLLPAAGYWKDRLHTRSLTSVLPALDQQRHTPRAAPAFVNATPAQQLWLSTPATGSRHYERSIPFGGAEIRQMLQF